MKLNVITGLPRSGSTLMCNVLNQNPAFHATSTDILPQLVASSSHICSMSPEFKSMLINEKEKATNRVINMLRGMVSGWFENEQDKTVFDKSRGWTSHSLLLRQLFPDAKFIVMIRDLRNIFASIEKQHRKNPIFDTANTPQEKYIYNRADQMFGPNGLIGGPLGGIEDLLRRDLPGTIYVQYEMFAEKPALIMNRVYEELGEKSFKHDFDNVENTAQDCDELYLGKYPHEGKGKVEPSQDDWSKYLSPDLARNIMEKFTQFNQTFGYK